MKMFRLGWAMAMATGLAALAQPSPSYVNYGVVTNVPQVDAVSFANFGVFSVVSQLPYETQNTLYFTNRGIMQGNPGFRLENVSTAGVRRPANFFFNDNGATIRGEESFGVIIGGGGGGFNFFEQSQVYINAVTNVNRGLLTVGANGKLSVHGSSLQFARSGLEVRPISDAFNFPGFCFFGGTPFMTPTNFVPDPGVYDQYWFITNAVINVGNNLGLQIDPDTSLVSVISPQHQVARVAGGLNCYFTNVTRLQISGAQAFVSTNQIDSTNTLVQAVIAANFDPNVNIGARFYPSTTITNPYQTMTVKLGGFESNMVTGEIFENAVYLIDRLTSETNYTLLTNLLTGPACPSLMPANFTLSRGLPCEYALGTLANSVLTPDLFFQEAFSNRFVTNFYAAYAANVANILTDLPSVPGVTVTNLPGRIEIEADNLDLRGTRMRAEGFLTVTAKHLIGSANAALDSQYTSLDLGSTNGTLRIQNMAKDQVQRWNGDIAVWSASWTNQLGTLSTNSVEDPPGSGTFTNQITTNVINIGFHALLLDGRMNTLQDAFVRSMTLNATNAVVSDSMVVVDSLLLNTERLTLDTDNFIALRGTALDWNGFSAPAVRYFTNYGTLSAQRDAFFGSDRVTPYASFVNRGIIDSYATGIRAIELEHSGTILANAGAVTMQADSLKIDGGQVIAWGDLIVQGKDLKFQGNVSEAWLMSLHPTNSLSDAGADANNIWRVNNGIELTRKPAIGDLLGTRIESNTPQWANVIHTWAGQDRGATAEGYRDNVAVGYLDLTAGFASATTFTGIGASNALYIDFLELGGSLQTDLLNTLVIDSNMVLYFADSNLPAEELDGLFADSQQPGGRLRWVPSFAGPNTSVDILLADGRVIQVNRALRNSLNIDSDGDGIPNGLDDAPFDNLVVTEVQVVNEPVPGTVAISWKAASGASYTVEYLDGMANVTWQALTVKVNTALQPGILTVLDTSAADSPVQRFYRVRLNP